jgi:WD40 repeat protein
MVIATSWTPEFTTYSSVAGLTSIPNHEQANIYLERSLDGRVFATYGFGDLVEIWDAANLTRTKVIHTAQQSVPQLSFVKDTDDIVTSGRDGRIIRWSLLGDAVTLASADQPTERFTVLAGGQLVVFSTVDGNLWRTGPDGKSHLIRPGAVRATCIISNGDDEVYVGFANGEVIVIDVTTWRQRTILRSARAIRDIVLNSQRKIIAVATNDDLAYVGSMRYPQDIVWTEISARASHLDISASGLLLAACSSGGLWIYASIHERWLFLDTGIRNLGWITASDDGTTAAAVDSDGNLLWIDLSTALELLNKTHTTTDTTHEPPKGNHI